MPRQKTTLSLGGDDADRGSGRRARQRRRGAVAAPGWPAGVWLNEAVQRAVLEAGCRLDRGDDLARHAELGERPKRRLLVGAEVAHGLVEADQPFLDEIVAVASGEEVRARLQPHEGRVAADQRIERRAVAVPRLENELEILKLSLSLLGTSS